MVQLVKGVAHQALEVTDIAFNGPLTRGRAGVVFTLLILDPELVHGLLLERLQRPGKRSDLVAALRDKKIAGAAIDVFDQEPLPLDHPFRALPNLLATPHIGYVSRGLYARFYQDTVANICRWLDDKVIARGDTPRQQSEK